MGEYEIKFAANPEIAEVIKLAVDQVITKRYQTLENWLTKYQDRINDLQLVQYTLSENILVYALLPKYYNHIDIERVFDKPYSVLDQCFPTLIISEHINVGKN